MLTEAIHYARMTLGIYEYLRTVPFADPQRVIREQLAHREGIFLELVRKVIFADPRNPYCQMFRLAGCTLEDLAQAVARDGLEATLAALYRQGVYVSHDEFKGSMPIVRSGQHIPARTSSFLNPLVSARIVGTSSGSRGKGTSSPLSSRLRLYREAQTWLRLQELGLQGRAHVEVKPILPSTTGLGSCLWARRLGRRVERWFADGGTLRDSGHYRWATHGMILASNILGGGVPFPSYLPPNDFDAVAAWIAARRAKTVPCFVSSFTSPAVRIAAAALDRGMDIRGTVFLVAGEALTDAKCAVIAAAGAEAYNSYPISELGLVGHACRHMKGGNSVHLFKDSLAVIGHRRPAPLTDVEVNSLLCTNLLPFASYILINAEVNDSGSIEPARCDCLFSRIGFTEQVRDINSFGKLTGQGMTLVGTDIVRILEEVLPARLGGLPGDYQLVEHEGPSQTQLTLRVRPRAGLPSPALVRERFMKEIRNYFGGALASRTWGHAEGVSVVIADPITTITGKVLPLHLLGSGGEKRHAP
jgi:hypothetical protein